MGNFPLRPARKLAALLPSVKTPRSFATLLFLFMGMAAGARAQQVANVTTAGTCVGGTSSSLKVTLNAVAGASGVVVALSSNRSTVAKPLASFRIPAGLSYGYTPITTYPVDANALVTLGARVGTGTLKLGNLLVTAPQITSLSPLAANVSGGVGTSLVLKLTGKVGPSGMTIALASSRPAAASVSAKVVIPAGGTAASVPVVTHGVDAAAQVTFTAQIAANPKKTCLLGVVPATLRNLLLAQSTIVSGKFGKLIVYLNGVAGPSGITASLSSSQPSIASLPATTKFPSGAGYGIVFVTTKVVTQSTSVTFSAKIGSGAAVTTVASVVTPGLASSAWPKFHGDARNSGNSKGKGATGVMKWDSQTDYPIYGSPVIGPDGTVYVVSEDSYVYAFDGQTGKQRWRFHINSQNDSTPAIGADGTVYIGADLVYALDGTTGAKKWSFDPGAGAGTPAIASDGTVYVSAGYYSYALDGATGAKKWVGGAFDTVPAIGADGTLYIFHNAYMTKIDPATGTGPSFGGLDTGVGGSPCIGPDGTIYVGTISGRLYAFSSAGAKLWYYTAGGPIRTSPAVAADGTVYFGADDGLIYAIKGGAKVWSYTTTGKIMSSPAIGGDGTVYIGSNDTYVYALDGATGAKKWAYYTGWWLPSSPAVGDDGTVFIGRFSGELLAIGGAHPSQRP